MKGLALTGIYIAALGLMVTGVETGRIPEEWSGALYLFFSLTGLGLVAVGIFMRDK